MIWQNPLLDAQGIDVYEIFVYSRGGRMSEALFHRLSFFCRIAISLRSRYPHSRTSQP